MSNIIDGWITFLSILLAFSVLIIWFIAFFGGIIYFVIPWFDRQYTKWYKILKEKYGWED